MTDQREFEGTGPGAGRKMRYVGVGLYPSPQDPKVEQCLFNIRAENLKVDSFVGKIIELNPPRWREAVDRIPPHWEYEIIIKAKGSDGNIHDYCFQISSHWKSPVMSNVINYLVGAYEMPTWDGFVELRAKTRKTQSGDNIMMVSLFGKNVSIPAKYPFNTTTGQWELPVDIRDANGRLDFQKSAIFWHNEYVKIGIQHFGWSDKLFISNLDLVPPTPHVTAQQAPQQPNATLAQKAGEYLKERVEASKPCSLEQFMQFAETAINTLKQRGGSQHDIAQLSKVLNWELSKANLSTQAGGAWNLLCQWEPAIPSSEIDDLPF